VGTFLYPQGVGRVCKGINPQQHTHCPRGYQSAWADDKAACPRYDYLENKFTLIHHYLSMVDALCLSTLQLIWYICNFPFHYLSISARGI